jgi:hypothetical protein
MSPAEQHIHIRAAARPEWNSVSECDRAINPPLAVTQASDGPALLHITPWQAMKSGFRARNNVDQADALCVLNIR